MFFSMSTDFSVAHALKPMWFFFLQVWLEMLQLFKKTLLTKKKRGLWDRCLRRTAFQSKLKVLDMSLRLSTSEIYKVCKQLTYATWLVPDACSQVSWVFRSCREENIYCIFLCSWIFLVLLSFSEMFVCLLAFPVLLEAWKMIYPGEGYERVPEWSIISYFLELF